jgi:hypothetical protein
MKLRFHNDSLRLRVSQAEMARLAETGRVEDTLTFAPGRTLSYSLETGPALAAAFDGQRISIVIPAAPAKHWMESDEAGIEGASGPLKVLIEKDFQCLHSSEEDADAFPNPMAKGS